LQNASEGDRKGHSRRNQDRRPRCHEVVIVGVERKKGGKPEKKDVAPRRVN